MRSPSFGISVVPNAADLEEVRRAVVRADELGFELLGIQDHPYQVRFLETWSLLADLLARTERIRLFPDVANLPLRLPAMIAKQAASLDVLSGARFELGLGAGAFWEGIAAMGGPVRKPRESLEALEEAIAIIRLYWSGERSISFEGRYYNVKGVHPGPAPAHRTGSGSARTSRGSSASSDGSRTAGSPRWATRRRSRFRQCGRESTKQPRPPVAIRPRSGGSTTSAA